MISSTDGRLCETASAADEPASAVAGLSKLRQIYCASARPWIGMGVPARNDSITPLRWLPGGPNSILVHGPHPSAVHDAIEAIAQSRAPAELVLDGAALGNVQVLVDAGWVCIAARPLMRRFVGGRGDRAFQLATTAGGSASGVVEMSSPGDYEIVRDVMIEAFGTDVGVAAPTTSDGKDSASHARLWALYEGGTIVSCATTVQVDDAVVLWDVATRPGCQRRGFGTALLNRVHCLCAEPSGVAKFLLSSTAAGYHMYESMGYETVGWWQAWSRPRWALGQA